jgi:small subunit ribosomal protein S9
MATKTTKKIEAQAKFYEAVGRRKSAVARVRLFEGASEGGVTVNDRTFDNYFPTTELRETVLAAFEESKSGGKFKVLAHVYGGGISAQAIAVRLGVARALTIFDPELRRKLKKEGFLKRDPRVKERRKFGLKKARKAPQWSKR